MDQNSIWLAGFFKNVPARKNLVVPPYKFSQDGNALTIGLSAKKEKA